jgi:hypothetical protein
MTREAEDVDTLDDALLVQEPIALDRFGIQRDPQARSLRNTDAAIVFHREVLARGVPAKR